MSEDRFDAIIVGGGLAGLSAGIELARNDMSVLVIERGDYCGAKNMTGGRLYGHSLETLIPDFASRAPIERRVTKEKVSLMWEESSIDVGFGSTKLSSTKDNSSYTVLRGKFDKWLQEEAEKAGCEVICGILVDDLIIEDGMVQGVIATGDELYADVVILADGVNSLLSQKLGLKEELTPSSVAVGAKEVIELGEDVINERFGLRGDEGMSWLTCGFPTMGSFGGGLLYTNKDSVSIGVVATLSDITYSGYSINQLLDRFKEHPCVKSYIEGGKSIEYSGHLVPEEGIHMIPKLYDDGVIVAGDAAGLCINLGFTVRGMDLAIESGRLAAKAVLHAHNIGSYKKEALSYYEELINSSFVMKDLVRYKGFPTLLSKRAIFETVPMIANDFMEKAFTVDGSVGPNLIMHLANQVAEYTGPEDLFNNVMSILEAF